MHNALGVCRLERFSDLLRDRQRFVRRKPAGGDPIRERRPLDQLHDEGVHAICVLEPVDLRDLRMIERGQHLGFALEAEEAIAIAGKALGQHLDRHVAIELRVASAVDHTHSACAEPFDDSIRPDRLPDHGSSPSGSP